MELYVVKENVKITPVTEVVSKTTEHNDCIQEQILEENDDSDASDRASGFQDDDCTVITLSDIPVTLMSICSDVTKHSEQFAKTVEMKLTKDGGEDNLGNVKLQLVISNDPNSLDGYFLLFGPTISALRQLDDDLDPDGAYHDYNVELSLCHLPTNNAAVSPESLLNLKAEIDFHCYSYSYNSYVDRLGSSSPVKVPLKMVEWFEQGTGFIYSKLNVKVTLNEDIVNWAYGSLLASGEFLKDRDFADLEIGCKNGEIVKCQMSWALRYKLVDMLQKGKNVGPWKLEMDMSREGVEALLAYVYCGNVSGGMRDGETALELLKACDRYEIDGLRLAIDALMMSKGSSDFKYFSVKSAVDLFLYARNSDGLKHLRNKAVCVLRNYLKSASDKILESKEYQDLFEKHPRIAMELSSLYIQLL